MTSKLKSLLLSPEDIIRGFAATPPLPNRCCECPYCQMPMRSSGGHANNAYPDDAPEKMQSPHLHFPDCAWRNAVEWVEREDKKLSIFDRIASLDPMAEAHRVTGERYLCAQDRATEPLAEMALRYGGPEVP